MFDPGLRPDVLLVAGGLAVDRAAGDPAFVAALGDLASRSKEVGSVCTGALLLAEAGLLSGRRATTHWALADRLADNHPEVRVDADSLYILDGVWTSAGVTSRIDLTLQLVRRRVPPLRALPKAGNPTPSDDPFRQGVPALRAHLAGPGAVT